MDIVLHLGAHKTATTYIQRRLMRGKLHLQRNGIAVLTPKRLRPALRAATERLNGKSAATYRRAEAAVYRELITDAELLGVERLVISEELLLGSLRQICQPGMLYGDIALAISPVVEAIDGRQTTLMLAVRDYADFLPSAYGQLLRGWRYIAFTDDLHRRLFHFRGGWPDVVTDLRNAFPHAVDLKVWQVEAFETLEREVFHALVGAAAKGLARPGGMPLAGPSGAAIHAIHELAKDHIPSTEEMRELLMAWPKFEGHPAFDPWTDEERAALTARYRADLAKLTASGLCSWIGDGPKKAAA